MTEQELQALAQLLSKAPLTLAESLWVRQLLARLAQAKQAEAA